MAQLVEAHKKIRVASDPGLDPGEEAPKGGVRPRRALPAERGGNGPPRSRRRLAFPRKAMLLERLQPSQLQNPG